SLLVSFTIGEASTGPTLVEVSATTQRNGFLNSRLDAQEGRSWVFNVTVTDNSGTGLNPEASNLELYFLPTMKKIEGDFTLQGDQLTFSVTEVIATDGSADGEYTLIITAEDNDPISGTLFTSVRFLNDTRPPDTLEVVADSARVSVTLAAVAPGSGIDIQTSLIEISFGDTPLSSNIVSYTTDGDSTLFADFNPPLTQPGLYRVNILAADRAGNQQALYKNFIVGTPEVIRPGIVQVSSLFGGATPTSGLTQPLRVSVEVQDNSGSGIDWQNSSLKLVGPDSMEITGTLSQQQNVLTLAISKVLSNSGSDDGLYTLSAHIEDLSPLSAHLDTSFTFILDNLAPDTAVVSFAPDTSGLSITLTDRPAVAGRASSGVDILSATATAADPTQAPINITLTHDGDSTLSILFTEGKPTAAGIYTVSVVVKDKAGNQRTRNISFPLNIKGDVVFFPPEGSVVRGPLARVIARVEGSPEPLAPGTEALLQVSYHGLPVAGSSSSAGDSLIFTFADTLAADGSADGRYEVLAEMNIPALGAGSTKRAFFTVDNTPPDTVSVEVSLSTEGVQVVARLTDGGYYPDVAGIDTAATAVFIEDPRGKEISPSSLVWLDRTTLQAYFDPLEVAGLHRLRLEVADRAGLTTTRKLLLINTFGLSEGRSVAFVEEVPARTQARLTFISGRSGKRITRALLRIFNLRGDLIRRLDVTDRIDAQGASVSAQWLLDNDGGSLVTNGIFIYYWEITFDDGSKERIKKTLAVARR
ncbi:MAG: hypothetical protein DRG82_17390, partial [Deltaproteobacteria bacterium]